MKIRLLSFGLSLIFTSTSLIPVASASDNSLTFENLYANRKSVSLVAWKSFNKQITSAPETHIKFKLLIGPNTKPLYKTPDKAIGLVARAFAAYKPAKEAVFIEYQFSDMKWAFDQMKKLVSPAQLALFNSNEGGMLVESNCMVGMKNCVGAKALSGKDGIAYVLIGVPNEAPPSKNAALNATSGMLEAHEYFHTVQDVPFVGKALVEGKWPPQWLTEGSADLVKNLAINSRSLRGYKAYMSFSSMHLYGNYINRDPKYLEEYLNFSNNKNNWGDYSSSDAYTMGNRICEILVAIRGPNSLVDMNYEMAKGIGFEAAFKNVYGSSWKSVQSTIAKTLAANITDGL